MKKKTIIMEWAMIILCFSLTITFLVAGMIFLNKSSGYFNNLTFVTKDNLVTSASKQENAIFSFTTWTELKSEYVSDASNTKRYDADIIAICGSSCCLFPFGKNLSIDDKKGCIAGISIAEKLFGTDNAEGREILWNGSKWVIRGVVKEPSDLLVIQASGITDKIHFNKISVALPEGADKRLAEENFISQHAITGQALRWDYLYGFNWIEEMIPSKWSDFEGWEQNLTEYKKAMDIVKNAEKSTIEATGLKYRRKGYWLIMSGIMLLAAGSFLVVCKFPIFNNFNK